MFVCFYSRNCTENYKQPQSRRLRLPYFCACWPPLETEVRWFGEVKCIGEADGAALNAVESEHIMSFLFLLRSVSH